MDEKELKAVDDQELVNISGGYKNALGDAICDSCGKRLSYYGGGLPLTGDRHICIQCLKRVKAAIGEDAISSWIKRNG